MSPVHSGRARWCHTGLAGVDLLESLTVIDPTAHLKIAVPYDAQCFNEAWKYFTGHAGYFVSNNIYSRLVVLDVFETGDIHPDLAVRWEALDSGRRYRFELDPSARWHDGQPVTAHDVAYTYRHVVDHDYQATAFLRELEEIRALDDHTVECVLDGQNAAFLAQLGAFVLTHIVPKHLYEGTDWSTNPHNWNPVGSGPFRFVEHVPGERIELAANEDYWRDGPHVGRLTYIVIPDKSDAHEALRSGAVHHCKHDVPASELDAWRELDGVAVRVDAGHSMGVIAFNFRRAPFRDRRVRDAFARVIDRRAVRDAIYRGLDTPRAYYLDHIDWAFNPDALAPDLDRDGAERLLDEAGFPRDAAGVRMRLTMATRQLYPQYCTAARVFKEQFASAGVELDVMELGPTDWQHRVGEAHDFDLAVDAGDIGPDPHQLAATTASDGARNISGYANAVVDDCFRRGREVIDRQARGAHYKKLQAELANDIARIPFLRYGEYLPYRTEFTGFSWSDGVRGTIPVWSMGQVRRAR